MTFSMSSLAYPHSCRKGTKLPLKQRHRAARSVSSPPHSSMELFLFSDVQAQAITSVTCHQRDRTRQSIHTFLSFSTHLHHPLRCLPYPVSSCISALLLHILA